jgi:hypothetical protein
MVAPRSHPNAEWPKRICQEGQASGKSSTQTGDLGAGPQHAEKFVAQAPLRRNVSV